MPSNNRFKMTSTERRSVLVNARRDIEKTMYATALTLGLDLDTVEDLTLIQNLWATPEMQPLSEEDPDYNTYNKLIGLADRLALIIEKLEGPNRVV